MMIKKGISTALVNKSDMQRRNMKTCRVGLVSCLVFIRAKANKKLEVTVIGTKIPKKLIRMVVCVSLIMSIFVKNVILVQF